MDFFAAAVQTQQPTTGKSKVKELVPIKAGNKVKSLAEVREKMADLKAQEAMLIGDIKPLAEEAYLRMFKENKVQPDSFVIQDETGGSVLLIVQDKYTKLEPGTMQAIQETWKKDAAEIIGTTTEFRFNSDVLDEYGAVITKALSEAIAGMEIPMEAKKKLLVAKTTHTIRKGTIARLTKYKNFDNLFQLIKPVFQFKNKGE